MNVLDVLADYLVEHAPADSEPQVRHYFDNRFRLKMVRIDYLFGTVTLYTDGLIIVHDRLVYGAANSAEVSSGRFRGTMADPNCLEAVELVLGQLYEVSKDRLPSLSRMRRLAAPLAGLRDIYLGEE